MIKSKMGMTIPVFLLDGLTVKGGWRTATTLESYPSANSGTFWSGPSNYECVDVSVNEISNGATTKTLRLNSNTYLQNSRVEVCQFHNQGSDSTPPNIGVMERYEELEQGLTELKEDEDWQIETGVYNRAVQIAAMIVAKAFPSPEIFTHSPTSVVFSWKSDGDKLYLTIGDQQVALLITEAQGNTRRAEISGADLNVTGAVFAALKPVASRRLALSDSRLATAKDSNV